MRLQGTFAGVPVKLWRQKWRRVLSFVGGDVGRLCPVTLYYRGSKRRALKEKQRLEEYGYRVTLERDRVSVPSDSDPS